MKMAVVMAIADDGDNDVHDDDCGGGGGVGG